mmetsp:Transcript_77178/g.243835  ORF Transcript_77178/g.243835 Transcript_77178/m.243835 type:complete len:300 (+) Transcript_77178:338-1237(+)
MRRRSCCAFSLSSTSGGCSESRLCLNSGGEPKYQDVLQASSASATSPRMPHSALPLKSRTPRLVCGRPSANRFAPASPMPQIARCKRTSLGRWPPTARFARAPAPSFPIGQPPRSRDRRPQGLVQFRSSCNMPAAFKRGLAPRSRASRCQGANSAASATAASGASRRSWVSRSRSSLSCCHASTPSPYTVANVHRSASPRGQWLRSRLRSLSSSADSASAVAAAGPRVAWRRANALSDGLRRRAPSRLQTSSSPGGRAAAAASPAGGPSTTSAPAPPSWTSPPAFPAGRVPGRWMAAGR